VKLSRNEKLVLLLDYDRDGRITLSAIRALGLKTTDVPSRLTRRLLLELEPWCGEEFSWRRTKHGALVRRLLIDPRSCDWCDRRATDGSPIKDSALHTYFCDAHEEIAYKSARGGRAFGKGNVANQVFGHSAVKKATREAAAA